MSEFNDIVANATRQPLNPKTNLPVENKENTSKESEDGVSEFNKIISSVKPYKYESVPQSQFVTLPDTYESYSKYLGNVMLGTDFEELRSEQQGTWGKTKNALLRSPLSIVAKIGAGFSGVAGAISTLPLSAFELATTGKITDWTYGTIFDNAFIDMFNSIEEKTENYFPIYNSNQYKHGNSWQKMWTADYWTQDFADGIEFLASAWAGGIITKPIQAAGKLTQLTGFGKKIIEAQTYLNNAQKATTLTGKLSKLGPSILSKWDNIVVTTYNTIAEASVEANHIKKDLIRSYEAGEWGQGLSKEEAKAEASKRALETFGFNTLALVGPNFIQSKWFGYGNTRLTKSAIAGAINKTGAAARAASSFWKQAAIGVVSEGLWEEGIQSAITNFESRDFIGKGFGDKLGGILGEYVAGFSRTDDQLAMITGAIIGGLMGGAGAAMESYQTDKEIAKLSQVMNIADMIYNQNFKSLYQTEQVEELNADGTPKLNDKGEKIFREKVKLDASGKPVINIESVTRAFQQMMLDDQLMNEFIEGTLNEDELRTKVIESVALSRLAIQYFDVDYGMEILEAKLEKIAESKAKNEPTQASEIMEALSKQKGMVQEMKKAWDDVKANTNVRLGDTKERQNFNILREQAEFYQTLKLGILEKQLLKFQSELTMSTNDAESKKIALKIADLETVIGDTKNSLTSLTKNQDKLFKEYEEENKKEKEIEEWAKAKEKQQDELVEKINKETDDTEKDKLTKQLEDNKKEYFKKAFEVDVARKSNNSVKELSIAEMEMNRQDLTFEQNLFMRLGKNNTHNAVIAGMLKAGKTPAEIFEYMKNNQVLLDRNTIDGYLNQGYNAFLKNAISLLSDGLRNLYTSTKKGSINKYNDSVVEKSINNPLDPADIQISIHATTKGSTLVAEDGHNESPITFPAGAAHHQETKGNKTYHYFKIEGGLVNKEPIGMKTSGAYKNTPGEVIITIVVPKDSLVNTMSLYYKIQLEIDGILENGGKIGKNYNILDNIPAAEWNKFIKNVRTLTNVFVTKTKGDIETALREKWGNKLIDDLLTALSTAEDLNTLSFIQKLIIGIEMQNPKAIEYFESNTYEDPTYNITAFDLDYTWIRDIDTLPFTNALNDVVKALDKLSVTPIGTKDFEDALKEVATKLTANQANLKELLEKLNQEPETEKDAKLIETLLTIYASIATQESVDINSLTELMSDELNALFAYESFLSAQAPGKSIKNKNNKEFSLVTTGNTVSKDPKAKIGLRLIPYFYYGNKSIKTISNFLDSISEEDFTDVDLILDYIEQVQGVFNFFEAEPQYTSAAYSSVATIQSAKDLLDRLENLREKAVKNSQNKVVAQIQSYFDFMQPILTLFNLKLVNNKLTFYEGSNNFPKFLLDVMTDEEKKILKDLMNQPDSTDPIDMSDPIKASHAVLLLNIVTRVKSDEFEKYRQSILEATKEFFKDKSTVLKDSPADHPVIQSLNSNSYRGLLLGLENLNGKNGLSNQTRSLITALDNFQNSPFKAFDKDRDYDKLLSKVLSISGLTDAEKVVIRQFIGLIKGLDNIKNIQNFVGLDIIELHNREVAMVEEAIKANGYVPTVQQLLSTRQLFAKIKSGSKTNKTGSEFIMLLNGTLGTGKTQIVPKWLMGLLNLSAGEVIAFGHNENTSRQISEKLGSALTSLEEFLKTPANTKAKLVVIDEMHTLSLDQLNAIAAKLNEINKGRSVTDQVFLLGLGDPYQNTSSGGTSSLYQGLTIGSTVGNYTYTSVFEASPLTVRYRSSVFAVNNFIDKFYAKTKPVTNLKASVSTDGKFGVNTVTDADAVITHLNQAVADGRTTAIVVANNLQKQIYTDKLKTQGIPYYDMQDTTTKYDDNTKKVQIYVYDTVGGITVDNVYVDIPRSNFKGDDAGTVRYNTAMYTALGRATQLINVVGVPIVIAKDDNATKSNITEELEEIKSLTTAVKTIEGETLAKVNNKAKTKVDDVVPPSAPVIQDTKDDTKKEPIITPPPVNTAAPPDDNSQQPSVPPITMTTTIVDVPDNSDLVNPQDTIGSGVIQDEDMEDEDSQQLEEQNSRSQAIPNNGMMFKYPEYYGIKDIQKMYKPDSEIPFIIGTQGGSFGVFVPMQNNPEIYIKVAQLSFEEAKQLLGLTQEEYDEQIKDNTLISTNAGNGVRYRVQLQSGIVKTGKIINDSTLRIQYESNNTVDGLTTQQRIEKAAQDLGGYTVSYKIFTKTGSNSAKSANEQFERSGSKFRVKPGFPYAVLTPNHIGTSIYIRLKVRRINKSKESNLISSTQKAVNAAESLNNELKTLIINRKFTQITSLELGDLLFNTIANRVKDLAYLEQGADPTKAPEVKFISDTNKIDKFRDELFLYLTEDVVKRGNKTISVLEQALGSKGVKYDKPQAEAELKQILRLLLDGNSSNFARLKTLNELYYGVTYSHSKISIAKAKDDGTNKSEDEINAEIEKELQKIKLELKKSNPSLNTDNYKYVEAATQGQNNITLFLENTLSSSQNTSDRLVKVYKYTHGKGTLQHELNILALANTRLAGNPFMQEISIDGGSPIRVSKGFLAMTGDKDFNALAGAVRTYLAIHSDLGAELSLNYSNIEDYINLIGEKHSVFLGVDALAKYNADRISLNDLRISKGFNPLSELTYEEFTKKLAKLNNLFKFIENKKSIFNNPTEEKGLTVKDLKYILEEDDNGNHPKLRAQFRVNEFESNSLNPDRTINNNWLNENTESTFSNIRPTTVGGIFDESKPQSTAKSIFKSKPNKFGSKNRNLLEVQNTDLGQPIEIEAAVKLVKQLVPDFNTEDIEFLSKIVTEEGKVALGRMIDGILQITSKQGTVSENVVRHEVFHLIWNYYLTEAERTKFRKMYIDKYGVATDDVIEENMAVMFQTWRANNSTIKRGWLKTLFEKILKLFGIVSRNADSIEELFYNINEGVYRQKLHNDLGIKRNMLDIITLFQGNTSHYRTAEGILLNGLTRLTNPTFTNIPLNESEATIKLFDILTGNKIDSNIPSANSVKGVATFVENLKNYLEQDPTQTKSRIKKVEQFIQDVYNQEDYDSNLDSILFKGLILFNEDFIEHLKWVVVRDIAYDNSKLFSEQGTNYILDKDYLNKIGVIKSKYETLSEVYFKLIDADVFIPMISDISHSLNLKAGAQTIKKIAQAFSKKTDFTAKQIENIDSLPETEENEKTTSDPTGEDPTENKIDIDEQSAFNKLYEQIIEADRVDREKSISMKVKMFLSRQFLMKFDTAGQLILEKDENGNMAPVFAKDEYGNKIPLDRRWSYYGMLSIFNNFDNTLPPRADLLKWFLEELIAAKNKTGRSNILETLIKSLSEIAEIALNSKLNSGTANPGISRFLNEDKFVFMNDWHSSRFELLFREFKGGEKRDLGIITEHELKRMEGQPYTILEKQTNETQEAFIDRIINTFLPNSLDYSNENIKVLTVRYKNKGNEIEEIPVFKLNDDLRLEVFKKINKQGGAEYTPVHNDNSVSEILSDFYFQNEDESEPRVNSGILSTIEGTIVKMIFDKASTMQFKDDGNYSIEIKLLGKPVSIEVTKKGNNLTLEQNAIDAISELLVTTRNVGSESFLESELTSLAKELIKKHIWYTSIENHIQDSYKQVYSRDLLNNILTNFLNQIEQPYHFVEEKIENSSRKVSVRKAKSLGYDQSYKADIKGHLLKKLGGEVFAPGNTEELHPNIKSFKEFFERIYKAKNLAELDLDEEKKATLIRRLGLDKNFFNQTVSETNQTPKQLSEEDLAIIKVGLIYLNLDILTTKNSASAYLTTELSKRILEDFKGFLERLSSKKQLPSDGEVTEQDKEEENQLVQYLEDSISLLDNISTSITDSKDKKINPSIKSVDNKRRFVFSLKSTGNTVLSNLRREFKKIKTQKENEFMQNNPIVKDTLYKDHNPETIVHDGYKLGETFSIEYSNESPMEWMRRNFSGYFLSQISTTDSSNKPTYIQTVYTISNKKLVTGNKLFVKSELGVKQYIGDILLQFESNTSEGSKYFMYYDNNRFINFDILNTLLEKEDKNAIAFKKSLETGNKITNDQREALIDSLYNEMSDITDLMYQDFIDNTYELPGNIGAILVALERAGIISEEIAKVGNFSVTKRDENNNVVMQQLTPEQETALKALFNVFVANQYVQSYALTQIVTGDFAYAKNPLDVVKRMSGAFGMGQSVGTTLATGTHFNLLIGKDISHIIADEIFKDTLVAGKVADINDAQMYMLPERREQLSVGLSREYDLGQVTKPALFESNVPVEINGKIHYVTVMLKASVVSLEDDICLKDIEGGDIPTNWTPFGVLRYNMRKMNVSEYAPLSAIKWGAPAKEYLADTYELFTNSEYHEKLNKPHEENSTTTRRDIATRTLSNINYRMQFNPDSKNLEQKVPNPSQLPYFLNILTGNETQAEQVYQSLAALMKIGQDKINKKELERIEEDKKAFKNKEDKLHDAVLDSIESPDAARLKQLIQQGISPSNPSVVTKYINYLASYFSKKTVEIKFPGNKLVLMSALGFTKAEVDRRFQKANLTSSLARLIEKSAVEDNLKPSIEDLKDGLRIVEEEVEEEVMIDGKLEKRFVKRRYAEVLVPQAWAKYVQVGNYMYSDAIGYRIPTSEMHSAIPLKVVGYLTTERTNLIVIPKEFVHLHGSDFDVDSLFVIRREVFNKRFKSADSGIQELKQDLADSINFSKKLNSVYENIIAVFKAVRTGKDGKLDPKYQEAKNTLEKLNELTSNRFNLNSERELLQNQAYEQNQFKFSDIETEFEGFLNSNAAAYMDWIGKYERAKKEAYNSKTTLTIPKLNIIPPSKLKKDETPKANSYTHLTVAEWIQQKVEEENKISGVDSKIDLHQLRFHFSMIYSATLSSQVQLRWERENESAWETLSSINTKTKQALDNEKTIERVKKDENGKPEKDVEGKNIKETIIEREKGEIPGKGAWVYFVPKSQKLIDIEKELKTLDTKSIQALFAELSNIDTTNVTQTFNAEELLKEDANDLMKLVNKINEFRTAIDDVRSQFEEQKNNLNSIDNPNAPVGYNLVNVTINVKNSKGEIKQETVKRWKLDPNYLDKLNQLSKGENPVISLKVKERLTEKYHKNVIVENMLEIITADRNKDRMLAPILLDRFNKTGNTFKDDNLYEDGTVFRYLQNIILNSSKAAELINSKKTPEAKAQVRKRLAGLKQSTDMSNIMNHRQAFVSNFEGLALTGVFANSMKAVAYIMKSGFKVFYTESNGNKIGSLKIKSKKITIRNDYPEHNQRSLQSQYTKLAKLKIELNNALINLDINSNIQAQFNNNNVLTLISQIQEIEKSIKSTLLTAQTTKTQEITSKGKNAKYVDQTTADAVGFIYLFVDDVVEEEGSKVTAIPPIVKEVIKSNKGVITIDNVSYEIMVDSIENWRMFDALLNAAVDNVKEQILPIINANKYTANAVGAALMLNIDINIIALLMNQPVIKAMNNVQYGQNDARLYQVLKNLNKQIELKRAKILTSLNLNDNNSLFTTDFVFNGVIYDNILDYYNKSNKDVSSIPDVISQILTANPSIEESFIGNNKFQYSGNLPSILSDTIIDALSRYNIETLKEESAKVKNLETTKLENGFVNEQFNVKFQDMTLEELMFQKDVANTYQALSKHGDDLFTLSRALSILKDMPVFVDDIMNNMEDWNAIGTFDANYNFTPNPSFSFYMSDWLKSLPHIVEAVKSRDLLYAKIQQLKMHDPEFIKPIDNLHHMPDLSEGHKGARSLVKRRFEFIKFLASSVYAIENEPHWHYKSSYSNQKLTHKGPKAFNQRFLAQLDALKIWSKSGEYKTINGNRVFVGNLDPIQHKLLINFLDNLEVDLNKYGERTIRFTAGSNIDYANILDFEAGFKLLNNLIDEQGNFYQIEFEKQTSFLNEETFKVVKKPKEKANSGTWSKLQTDFLKYAAINYGVSMGLTNYSTVLPVELLKDFDNALQARMEDMLSVNPSLSLQGKAEVSNRDVVLDLFRINIIANNSQNIPWFVGKTINGNKINAIKNGEYFSGKDVINNVPIFYDLKLQLVTEENNYPQFIRFGRYNTAYVKVYTSDDNVYYKQIGSNRQTIYELTEQDFTRLYSISLFFNPSELTYHVANVEVNGTKVKAAISQDVPAWLVEHIKSMAPSIDYMYLTNRQDVDKRHRVKIRNVNIENGFIVGDLILEDLTVDLSKFNSKVISNNKYYIPIIPSLTIANSKTITALRNSKSAPVQKEYSLEKGDLNPNKIQTLTIEGDKIRKSGEANILVTAYNKLKELYPNDAKKDLTTKLQKVIEESIQSNELDISSLEGVTKLVDTTGFIDGRFHTTDETALLNTTLLPLYARIIYQTIKANMPITYRETLQFDLNDITNLEASLNSIKSDIQKGAVEGKNYFITFNMFENSDLNSRSISTLLAFGNQFPNVKFSLTGLTESQFKTLKDSLVQLNINTQNQQC